uniref:Protein cereblon n=1 Tax=Dunaliella tertiolecta TaxID=3047 RepID=A0A7S3QSM9_DUNTE
MLDEGACLPLPLVKLKGVILFPGSILPLIIGGPLNQMNVGVCMDLGQVLDDASPTSKLLVVINHRGYYSPDRKVVGCTAEIRQLRRGNRAGRGAILVGRQRVLVDLDNQWREGVPRGCYAVTVLPRDYIPPVPEVMKSGYTAWAAPSAAPYDVSTLTAKARSLVAQRFPKLAGGPLLPHPSEQAQPEDQKQGQAPAGGGTSTDPEPYRFVPANPPAEPLAFSNWLAANLPLASKYRRLLLDAPSAAHRLRAEIDHLQTHMDRALRCGRCTAALADAQDLFVSTEEGAGAIFCNEYGYVHDSVSFSKLRAGARVRLQRPAQEKHSFYPGYIWWIASCGRCNNHLGWRFRAPKPNMRPTEFWGIRRDALTEILPTPEMAAMEEEAEAARQGHEGESASIEETGGMDDDDDIVVTQPLDLLQHLQAVMNQPGPGDEEVEHNMPRGQLAQALLEITNFIRQSTQQQQRQQQQQPVGWEMHHAGEPDEGRGAGHMVSTGEEESEWEEADGADAGEEDSYTTASTSVAEEPPSGGGEEGQEGQGSA